MPWRQVEKQKPYLRKTSITPYMQLTHKCQKTPKPNIEIAGYNGRENRERERIVNKQQLWECFCTFLGALHHSSKAKYTNNVHRCASTTDWHSVLSIIHSVWWFHALTLLTHATPGNGRSGSAVRLQPMNGESVTHLSSVFFFPCSPPMRIAWNHFCANTIDPADNNYYRHHVSF